ncbi:MAG: hypothetical protein BWY65_01987 [Firmicutes bacterium ADurb.Bin373]|nr:hypothetical protein [Bacillota bacterium]OQA07137.1 MAG: hypothetical protein BWY65_01987 [Firmicutes bacterium ADurb.Bin373]
MSRLTRAAVGNNYYLADDSKIQHDAEGYTGEAVTKLAKFENLYEDLLARQNDIAKELEALRLEDKTRTLKFKQLFANKLTNSNILTLFKSYGL